MIQAWHDVPKGVEVKPAGFNEVNIIYNGLLANCGADQVYLHYGFGDPLKWQNVNTVRMDRTMRGWEATVRMLNSTMSFCFKDSANNWDNNNGYNWTVRA
ncbi:carbohydrate-binding protein [Desulfovirgula thermocuniculi]|uniref:carbohydrate-binding protein n=1 Tax=Desulfovirgula thermocuniculi TaxID=348842 RepID=UPI0003FAB2C2|nr:carbohydrate-binding protein [Desulfovirgula thermocuniculi]